MSFVRQRNLQPYNGLAIVLMRDIAENYGGLMNLVGSHPALIAGPLGYFRKLRFPLADHNLGLIG
jgi:hypothetical protein